MALFQLLYLSRTRLDWTEPELAALTADAQERNARLGLTGLLLYGNGHFLQLLEGRRQPLLLTYDRIARDARHTDLQTLLDAATTRRTFPRWAMGLLNLEVAGEVDRDRFTRIVQGLPARQPAVTDPMLALRLLKEFRDHVAAGPRDRPSDLS